MAFIKALFDKKTPTKVKLILVGAVLYALLPFDFVPDFLPFIGFIDDLILLVSAISYAWERIKKS